MVMSVVALVIAAAACYKAARRWQLKGGGAYERTHKRSPEDRRLDAKKNVRASFDSLTYHRELGIRQAQSTPLGGDPHRWKITDDAEKKRRLYELKKEGRYPPFLMLKIRAVFPKLNEKFSKTICALIRIYMSNALSGCVVIEEKNNILRYRRKCEKCGNISNPFTTTSIKGKGIRNLFSFAKNH